MKECYKDQIVKYKTDIFGLLQIPSFVNPDLNNYDDMGYAYEEIRPYLEITDCNLSSLETILDKILVKNIVEIGVARNGNRSFTHTLIKRKTKDGIYCGIDLDDKSFLNDNENKVYTIRSNSHDQDIIRNYLKEIGMNKIDVLFIDGWHSINTVINDWKYSDLLSDKGVVIFHDTNYHPGPNIFLDFIDRNIYTVIEYCTNLDDYGLAAAFKK
jgi:hypothetical protein